MALSISHPLMPDSKITSRPQQSCLRCRERKVKCDRTVPCHACILRGLKAEGSYLATPEDRAHITQSEIIDRLRREVVLLRQEAQKARTSSSARNGSHSQSRKKALYARSSGVISLSSSQNSRSSLSSACRTSPGHSDSMEGSSSSPSSNANSVHIASPDSSGNDSVQTHATFKHGMFEVNGATDPIEDVIAQSGYALHSSFQSYQLDKNTHSSMISPKYTATNALGYMPGTSYSNYQYKDEQWGEAFGHQFTPTQPLLDSYYLSNNPTNNHDSQPLQNPDQIAFSIPNAWRGQVKYQLLRTLLDTISACDEGQVDQVVQVVRTSATPEEAVSRICRIMGFDE